MDKNKQRKLNRLIINSLMGNVLKTITNELINREHEVVKEMEEYSIGLFKQLVKDLYDYQIIEKNLYNRKIERPPFDFIIYTELNDDCLDNEVEANGIDNNEWYETLHYIADIFNVITIDLIYNIITYHCNQHKEKLERYIDEVYGEY